MHARGPEAHGAARRRARAWSRPATSRPVADIEILNPELVLCTLDEGAAIRMEFTVATGKGYVPADRNRPEDAPIGLIPVDSALSAR